MEPVTRIYAKMNGFKENLRYIEGDNYKQIPKILSAWTDEQPICPEVEILIKEKGLFLAEKNPEKYFMRFYGDLEKWQIKMQF